MGGVDPHTGQSPPARPAGKYRITFLPMGETVEVDPQKLPCVSHGLPGSILHVALGSGIGIDHACGGVCACATCHVFVRDGLHTLNQPTEEEQDQLDEAPGVKPTSRLACQAVPSGEADMVVEIPTWNRNLVKEGH